MVEPKTVIPERLAVLPQPAVDDVEALATRGYRTLINNRPENESADQPSADRVRAQAERAGLRYVQIPVSAASIGRQDVDAFRAAVAAGPHPVAAHCGTGRRSYLLWAAGEAVYEGRPVAELIAQGSDLGLDVGDLAQIVQQVRQESPD